MYYCGIDVAKREHEACVLNDRGQEVFHQRFKNRRLDADRFVRQLQEKLGAKPEEVTVVMEATGHYWLNLYGFLTQRGFQVRVLNPIQSDAARNLYLRKTKTDARDAFILADLLRMDRASDSRQPNDGLLRLQALERFRYELVTRIGSLKQRVLGILDRIFPEYETLFSEPFVRSSRELLMNYPTPEELAAADLSELAALLSKASRGRLGEEKALEVQHLARNSFGITLGLDSFALELKLLLAQIEFLEGQVETVEAAIDQALTEVCAQDKTEEKETQTTAEKSPRHVLETVPGVGPVVLATLLGEVPDISTFINPRRFVAFAGIDASVKESGEFQGTRMHISKRGSPYLRRALWYCAQAAKRCDERFNAYYQRKLQEGKHPKVATVALMRKLAVVIYYIWRSGKPYDPDYVWKPTPPLSN
ncbi:MAG: Transposase IS116/IS110/IS902 family protein [Clostridia bacterium 62_21]|nr:MAG: Transposase IS116/IS110/IS902 family protein [Clostridia bacterium 62_21]